MIYKSIPINYYPSDLGSTYNCTITDQRQNGVTKLLSASSAFLYDLTKATNTSTNNSNSVLIQITRQSGNINLGGYEYWTNTTSSTPTSSVQLNTSSTTINISNLRDPGAKINIYGRGSGIIDTSGGYAYEGEASISSSYGINITSFSYPTSSFTVEVTPSKSYSGASIEWKNYTWYVRSNSSNNIISNVTNNINANSKGSFTVSIPWNTKWEGTPTITVYCMHLEAIVKTSSQQKIVGININRDGWQSSRYGWIVTGWSEIGGSGAKYSVPYGTYYGEPEDGWYPVQGYDSQGNYGSCWTTEHGDPIKETVGGDTYHLEYYG